MRELVPRLRQFAAIAVVASTGLVLVGCEYNSAGPSDVDVPLFSHNTQSGISSGGT